MNGSGTPVQLAPGFGALFDWDGVIVDSKQLHQAAWDEVARELGYPHGPEDFARTFGTQNWRAISEILWASTSCISRAMRVRSAARACSSRSSRSVAACAACAVRASSSALRVAR